MVDNGRYFSIPKRREWRHKPTIFFTVQLNLTLQTVKHHENTVLRIPDQPRITYQRRIHLSKALSVLLMARATVRVIESGPVQILDWRLQ